MYELALDAWGVTPEYINRRWTEELLALLWRGRVRRLRRLAEPNSGAGKNILPLADFLAKHGGGSYRRINHG